MTEENCKVVIISAFESAHLSNGSNPLQSRNSGLSQALQIA